MMNSMASSPRLMPPTPMIGRSTVAAISYTQRTLSGLMAGAAQPAIAVIAAQQREAGFHVQAEGRAERVGGDDAVGAGILGRLGGRPHLAAQRAHLDENRAVETLLGRVDGLDHRRRILAQVVRAQLQGIGPAVHLRRQLGDLLPGVAQRADQRDAGLVGGARGRWRTRWPASARVASPTTARC